MESILALLQQKLLLFMKQAVETAINRGHSVVREEDILTAELAYSNDMLFWMSFELKDIKGTYAKLL